MTREEAIKELKIQFLGEYGRQREAKDIAIKALEQEPRKGKWISKPHVYGGLLMAHHSPKDMEG